MNKPLKRRFRFALMAIAWLALILGSYFKNSAEVHALVYKLALDQAQTNFNKDVIYRKWIALQGGVYVIQSEHTPPNPFLKVPNRDVETKDGQKLTLVNPAYTTRMVHELEEKADGVKGHITSLNPLRLENKPDKWETKALKLFEKGTKEYHSVEKFKGKTVLRFMSPLIVEQSCLKCHAEQGYKIGDIRGGISISVPYEKHLALVTEKKKNGIIFHSIFFIVGLAGLFFYTKSEGKYSRELEQERKNYLSLSELSPLGVIVQTDGKFVYVNNAALDIFKLGVNFDIIGKSVEAIFNKDSIIKTKEWYQRAEKDKNSTKQFIEKITCLDGTIKELEVNRTPMTFNQKSSVLCVIKDLTELQKSYQDIQNNKDRLKALIEALPDMILVFKMDGTILESYSTDENNYYLTSKDLIGKKVTDILPEEVSSEVLNKLEYLFTSGNQQFHNYKIKIDQEIKFYESRITLKGKDEALAVIRDVTARKQQEESIRKLNRMYVVLSNINQTIVRTRNKENLYSEICEIAKKDGGFLVSWIGILNQDNIVDIVASSGGNDEFLKKMKIDLAEADSINCIAKHAFKTGNIIHSGNIMDEPIDAYLINIATKLGIQSTISLPIKIFDKTIGVFSLCSGEADFFNKDEIVLLTELASDISFALEFIESDVNRKQAEEAITAMAKRNQTLLQTSSDGIHVIDEHGNVVEVNSAFCKMHGYTREEIMHFNVSKFNAQFSSEELPGIIKEMIEHPAMFETRHRRKDGIIIDVEINVSCVELEGRKYLYAACRDITERKNAAERIKESEKNLQDLADNLLDGVAIADKNGNFVYVNPKVSEITGYSKDELLKMTGWDITRKEDLEKLRQRMKDRMEDKPFEKNYERIIVRKDGTELFTEMSTTTTIWQGKKLPMSIIRDITKRKLREKEERQRWEQLAIQQEILLDIATSPFLSEGDIKNLAKFLNERVAKQMQVERVSIWMFNDTGTILQCVDLYELSKNLHSSGAVLNEFEFKNELDALKKSKYIDANEPLTDPRTAGYVETYIKPCKITSMLDGVIRYSNISYGTFCLEHLEQKHQWTTEEINFVCQLADQFALTIANYQKKKTESALRESEEKFRNIFKNHSAVKLLIDPENQNIVDANNAAAQFYGWSIEELKKMKISQINILSPDEINNEIKKALTRQRIYFEFKHRKADGSVVDVEVYTSSVNIGGKNFLHSIVHDVTEKKLTERELQKHAIAVKQSPAVIVITDIAGNIEYVNTKFTEVSGYTFDEVIGKNPRILSSGEKSSDEYKHMWDTILKHQEWRGEFHNKRKNGELYWESALLAPIINERGEITNFIAVKEDVTEQKKLNQELIEAKEKAEEMNKVKSYFFANMSHELRTPFVGIMGFSELLVESLPDSDYKEYALQISKSARRLTDTLNKILDVTQLEFSKYELDQSEVDINELVTEISGLYSQSCKKNNSNIKTKLIFDKRLIRTDKKLLEEILNNLISNAVKYTEDGSIEVTTERIIIDNKNILELVVSDSGAGIPKEKQDIIWQEFRQVSEGFNRSFEGTGLGLSIVKKYVDLLNGKIYLESEVGKGSIFKVQIPISISEVNTVEVEKVVTIKEMREEKEAQEIKEGRKPKLLYVEDDTISLNYVCIILKSLYDVGTTLTAKAAIDLVSTNQYDALMLDINLGRDMDGVELMEKIRQKENYKNIPIIALTAYAADSDKIEFLSKGFTHYLSKPFTSSELTNLLNKIFMK